jgi:hypothetical protein
VKVHRVRIAVPHQKIVQSEVDLVLTDIVCERVHDLAALLIPNVVLALHQCQRTFAANFAGTPGQIAIQKMVHDSAHVVLAVLVLHDHVGGIL